MEDTVGADSARLRAVSQSKSGARLQALPSLHQDILLDGDSLRVAVALRLQGHIPHRYICATMVEAYGHHAMTCVPCSDRFLRHHALNDIVRRALISANIPCVLEPPGVSRSDGKRLVG